MSLVCRLQQGFCELESKGTILYTVHAPTVNVTADGTRVSLNAFDLLPSSLGYSILDMGTQHSTRKRFLRAQCGTWSV
jgi:hypothetical protein